MPIVNPPYKGSIEPKRSPTVPNVNCGTLDSGPGLVGHAKAESPKLLAPAGSRVLQSVQIGTPRHGWKPFVNRAGRHICDFS